MGILERRDGEVEVLFVSRFISVVYSTSSPINFDIAWSGPLLYQTPFPFLCSTTTADSLACIHVGHKIFSMTCASLLHIYSCFPKPTTSLVLPHCIVDFQGPGIPLALSDHQVQLGMVSALYQRRALGFPHQFVFGIFYLYGYYVNVYAARWEPAAKPGTNTEAEHRPARSTQKAGELPDPPTDVPRQSTNRDTQEPSVSTKVILYSSAPV